MLWEGSRTVRLMKAHLRDLEPPKQPAGDAEDGGSKKKKGKKKAKKGKKEEL